MYYCTHSGRTRAVAVVAQLRLSKPAQQVSCVRYADPTTSPTTLHANSAKCMVGRVTSWRSKLSGLTVAHPQRPLGDCRAIVHSLLPPPQLLEARRPGRGTCPRSACQVCTHYGTSPTLPMWQPLAPQRAGPSVRITSVPMSGRARGAWPLSHPPSLLSAPNLVLGEHAFPAEIQAAQRLWEQYDLWDS